jgi:hypothetical protein
MTGTMFLESIQIGTYREVTQTRPWSLYIRLDEVECESAGDNCCKTGVSSM